MSRQCTHVPQLEVRQGSHYPQEVLLVVDEWVGSGEVGGRWGGGFEGLRGIEEDGGSA